MRSRLALPLFVAAVFASSFTAPTRANAGGAVLRSTAAAAPTFDVQMAVASGNGRSTRWSELTIAPSQRVLWLVPARPGAAVDWAPSSWLASLDNATALRLLPPLTPTSCELPTTPQRATSWTHRAAVVPAPDVAVHTSAEAVRSYASAEGFAVSAAADARIGSLFDAGFNLVSLEVSSGSLSASSGTLRVSDDGAPVLPLALTGESRGIVHVTAFTIGRGVAVVDGARDVETASLRWGASGSSFELYRRDVVEGGMGKAWLRESASHAALFDGTKVPDGGTALPITKSYFAEDRACGLAVAGRGSSSDPVGIACAAGAVAKVPGGSACTPTSGPLDPAAFACGDLDDLALALSGNVPRDTVVTRWSGMIAPDAFGRDERVSFDPALATASPVVRAGSFEPCSRAPDSSEPGSSSSLSPPMPSTGGGGRAGGGGWSPSSGGYYASQSGGGCGGSTTTSSSSTVVVVDEGGDEDDTSSSDSCSGSSTGTGDDGWDSEDDSGDSCSGDDSSSSSSSADSCSGGSSSSSSSGGSDDGWDTEDEAAPSMHARHRVKRKRSSPVSRIAVLAFALVLPLRRRARKNAH